MLFFVCITYFCLFVMPIIQMLRGKMWFEYYRKGGFLVNIYVILCNQTKKIRWKGLVFPPYFIIFAPSFRMNDKPKE